MMEEVKVYLFMICDRRISQYKGIGKDNQRDFQLQRYSNDETSIVFQGFTDDFWNEWKYNSSYHENDNVAFAFLSDDETFNPEIKQDFNFIQPAAFFPKTLIMEFMEKLEFNNITLVYKGKEEKIFNKAVFGYEGQKKFYLKMYPSEPSENYVEQSDSSEYTFIDFLKELRENNIEQLVSKPENTGIIPDNDDHNQSPISQASVEDRIKSLISNGESMRIEFKETFSKNAKNIKNPRDPELIRESLKTIVAFLNTYGGTLLIGVTDKGEIKGVEDDFFENRDKYLLYFSSHLNDLIGVEFIPFIKYDLFFVEGKQILVVECKPSNRPCYYDDKEFFIRINPATHKLEGSKLDVYKKERFK